MQPKAISVDNERASVEHLQMKTVPNLEMIARRLNLSQSTISRALNDYSDISKQTKKLVCNAANEMGYQPNIYARRLASGKSETVAYLMPAFEGENGNSFVGELISGMSSVLSESRWDLTVLSPATTEDEIALFQKIARNRHISGLVISRTLVNDPRFEILRNLQIPFITHGRSHSSEETAWIDVDNEKAFFQVTNHLFDLGHRKIAHIGGPLRFNFSMQRADGWQSAMLKLKVPNPNGYHQISDLSFKGGKEAMHALLALENPPTAVCCVSDVTAIGAMQALRENNIVPGGDVSIIGYDGLEIGKYVEPPLSTMTQPRKVAGEKIAKSIMGLIETGNEPKEIQELLSATILRRGTDNPPNRVGSNE
tara:strand:- start:3918 stop:5018 length:1101 start_codon:yes stop_codon:yes gene_type:complete